MLPLRRFHVLFAASLMWGLGCSEAPTSAPLDGGAADAPRPDTGGSASADAGEGGRDPNGILGTLGSCPDVRAEISRGTSSFLRHSLSFAPGETYSREVLSPGGQRLFDTPNAGGSSSESEVLSFEVLHFCEGASLEKTETEIAYADPDDAGPSSITDILVSIDGRKLGVSVTRAYKPAPQVYGDADAQRLLEDKLAGVVRSTQRVKAEDAWAKQILHVFCATDEACDAVARVYPTLDASLRRDTVVLLTQTSGGGFIYCNPDPPLGAECPAR